MRPEKLPVLETLRFIERALPARPARILDVGSGRGDVAVELKSLGFSVVALDVSEEAVLVARSRNLEAVHKDFFAFEGGPFDVLLLSRSLHHLAPLDQAVERADSLLKPGGVLAIEELDIEAMDQVTALWHYDALALLEAAGVVTPDPEDAIPQDIDPLSRWHIEHEENPPLATAAQMFAAVSARFDVVQTTTAPYLYRTACSRMEETARGQRAAERLLALERQRIERGLVRAIGWRCVARKRAPTAPPPSLRPE